MLEQIYNKFKNRVDTLHQLIGYSGYKHLLERRNFGLALKLLFWETRLSLIQFFILIIKSPAQSFLILKQSHIKGSCDYSYLEHIMHQKRTRLFSLTGFSTVICASLILSFVFSYILPEIRFGFAKTNDWQQDDWSGNADESNFPNDTNNQTGWTKYYSVSDAGDVTADAASIRSAVAGWSAVEDQESGEFGQGSQDDSFDMLLIGDTLTLSLPQ